MATEIFHFILAVLAAWRITHLLSLEDGPWNLVYLLRLKAGTGFAGKLLDCFYCSSVWVALPFGMLAGNNWWEKLLYWWAVSGASCLLQQATTIRNTSEPVVPDYKED